MTVVALRGVAATALGTPASPLLALALAVGFGASVAALLYGLHVLRRARVGHHAPVTPEGDSRRVVVVHSDEETDLFADRRHVSTDTSRQPSQLTYTGSVEGSPALLLAATIKARDVRVTTRCRFKGARAGGACGLVFRQLGAATYHVARANRAPPTRASS